MSNILNIEGKKYLYNSIIKNIDFDIETFNKFLDVNPAEKYYNDTNVYELNYNTYTTLGNNFITSIKNNICDYIDEIKQEFYNKYKCYNTSIKYYNTNFDKYDFSEIICINKLNTDIKKSLLLSEIYLNMFVNTSYFNSEYYIKIEKEDINFNNSKKTKQHIKEEQEENIINELHKKIYSIGIEKTMTQKQIIYYKYSEKLKKNTSKIKFLNDVINNYELSYNFNNCDFNNDFYNDLYDDI
jgi:hypothetical protein